jgi:TonB family protein
VKFPLATLFCTCLLTAHSCFSEPQQPVGQKSDNPAVAAYQKKVYDVIGARWYQIMNRDSDLITLGKIHVTFLILPTGHVEDIRILRNTSNRHFETVAREAIQSVRIPAIPAAVLRTLPKHRMEEDISFEAFANPQSPPVN